MWKKLILVGDSNTEYGYTEQGRWVSMLSNALSRCCDVINRGFSAFTSQHLRIILPSILKEFYAQDIFAITFMLGTNDSAPSSSHVPIDEYTRLMKEMIELTLNHGVASDKIIIMTPPIRKYSNETLEPYAASCIQLVKDYNLTCFDLRSLMKNDGENIDEYLTDGLHFSEYGSRLLFKGLWSVLKKLMEKYDLEYKYPVGYWKDLLKIQELKDNYN